MTSDDTPAGPAPDPPADPSPDGAVPDPLRRAAELVAGTDDGAAGADALERRLKRDALRSIGRIKPAAVEGVDFEADVLGGDFFAGLPAPLQGIAIARTEGVLAFYHRVGWTPRFLGASLEGTVPDEGLEPLRARYHATDLHDLAYVHPKHFEKMLGKPGAAALWETLKRRSAELRAAP